MSDQMMSQNITWIVNLDASANEASTIGKRVEQWLAEQGIVNPGKELPGLMGKPLFARGPSAALWDDGSFDGPETLCGLEIAIGRKVYHTGGHGIDALRCPSCNLSHDPDVVPWSDAVGAWHACEGDDHLACPGCAMRSNIVDWDFTLPWGFGNLAFGFWNWSIDGRIHSELSALTGHRYRVVHEQV